MTKKLQKTICEKALKMAWLSQIFDIEMRL
uniref:Uncharacterized protein n=1 Tax=Phage sp. ctGns7 TaxID=2828003 RepID=A0A8S5S8V8_9VIRU|nr:MAG TPA: hypothetical protein [Phage sp. ctGns7]